MIPEHSTNSNQEYSWVWLKILKLILMLTLQKTLIKILEDIFHISSHKTFLAVVNNCHDIFVVRTWNSSSRFDLPLNYCSIIQGQFFLRVRADAAGCCLATKYPEFLMRLHKQALFTHSEKLQDVAML